MPGRPPARRSHHRRPRGRDGDNACVGSARSPPSPWLAATIPCVIDLDRRQRVTLTWAAIALVITAFEGSVLVIALPAVATEFHASTPALSDLLSVLAIGTLGALPLSTLADKFGRKRLIAVGVAGSSLANLASGFAPSIAILAFFKLFAVCFEVLVAGVVTALIVEEAPAEHRGAAVSVIALLSGIGIFLVVVAYPVIAPHWRWLYYAGGAGVLVAPLIWWLLPESKTWQQVRLTGSALRLLMQRPWRRRVLILAAMTALLAVLLEPAGACIAVVAALGSRAGLQAVGLLSSSTGLGGAIPLGGVAAVAGALLLFLLPETRRQPLPE